MLSTERKERSSSTRAPCPSKESDALPSERRRRPSPTRSLPPPLGQAALGRILHELDQVGPGGEDRRVEVQVGRPLGDVGGRERRDGPVGLVELVGGGQAQSTRGDLETLRDGFEQLLGGAAAEVAPIEAPRAAKVLAGSGGVLGDRQQGEVGQDEAHRQVELSVPFARARPPRSARRRAPDRAADGNGAAATTPRPARSASGPWTARWRTPLRPTRAGPSPRAGPDDRVAQREQVGDVAGGVGELAGRERPPRPVGELVAL